MTVVCPFVILHHTAGPLNMALIGGLTCFVQFHFRRMKMHFSSHQLLLTFFAIAAAVNGFPFGGPSPPGGPPSPPFGPPHGGPPFHGSHPDFLMEISENAHREGLQVFMNNDGKPKAELKAALENWAEKSGVKEEYAKFIADHEKKRNSYHDLVVENLAGDALAAFNKIWEISENEQISRLDECKQIHAVKDELKMKIRDLVPFVGPKIPGPPPPECSPHGPPPHFGGFGENGQQREREGFGPGQPPSFQPPKKFPKKGTKSVENSE